MLGLLSLPQSIQDDISNKLISMGHARVLSKLNDEAQQKELAEKIISEGISVRQLEELSQSPTIIKTNPQKPRIKQENPYQYLQEELSEKLGTKVKIRNKKMEISFENENDLNRLLECMSIGVEK